MKKYLVVTGGAGFIGSNLIRILLKKTNYQIISLDNYSSGSKNNHFYTPRVKYIKGETKKINKLLSKYKNKIVALFHFGEFSRIYQSFLKFNDCYEANTIGTGKVFHFCYQNKIKLIYSATSAAFGNKEINKNLSPYAFTKSKNIELLENMKKWFKFRFEIIYFYNVYGKGQIEKGDMATVIGIFQNQFKNKQPLTVVKPGTQSRNFTHVDDTVKVCYEAWKLGKCRHYSISHKESYSILDVAKLFKSKIKYLKARKGERYASVLSNISYNYKVKNCYGKIKLKDYITSFINSKKI